MKYLFLLVILTACETSTYIVDHCYEDGIYHRIIKINSQYKDTWQYHLYLNNKDVGEFWGMISEVEVQYPFETECPK